MIPGTLSHDAAIERIWDAVVVGAGPAGSVAAREIARRGRSVLLLDKASFPRPKVCGCCLNGSALATLSRIGLGHLTTDLGAIPLMQVTLAAGGRTATLGLPSGVAVGRDVFDVALIHSAIAANAEFLPGTSAKLGPIANDLRSLDLGENRVLRSRVVIAADGLNGQFTATDGNAATISETSRIGAGVIVGEAPSSYESGTIYMAAGRHGYVGLVRLEDGRLDLAAAFDPAFVRTSGGLGAAGEAVLHEAGFPIIPGLADRPWKGTPALTRTARRIAGDRWFAIGDAAGYVEPFTGEGMAWGMASAAAVAPLAAADWTPTAIPLWNREYARIIRARQGTCRVIARVLRSPSLCRLSVKLLSALPALSLPVVAALNRPSRSLEAVA